MLKEITANIYHLLHPKMTFFLTSINRIGRPNVMTCAWATPVSDEPPMVIICVSKESYTAELIRETMEFVINIPTQKFLKALWTTGKISGMDIDKFKKARLKTINAKSVKPPLIKGCVGYIECRLWRIVEAGECYAFFGRVLSSSADNRYFKKGMWTGTTKIPMHLGKNKMVYFRGGK